jgi:tight adherence protein C
LPSEGWDKSPFRLRFIHAGYRGGSAPTVFFTAKTVLALCLPFSFSLVLFIRDIAMPADIVLLWLLTLAAAGYYLPNVYLARRITGRKLELFETFPDAVDLVMVCVESGLGLDASIVRAGEEMRLRSPVLADELQLVALELRAGGGRDHALRNLAMRTGMEEVDNLVSMLIQADKFGTSVADSLRVYADTLRTKRRLRAEEAAAKIALKLLFPLIFCIFPALLLVLMGPAFISIYRILLPTMSGS